MSTEPNNPNPLDDATSRRLAQLGQRHVDVSDLENKLGAALADTPSADVPHIKKPGPAHTYPIRPWLRPVTGIAAALALAATLFIALSSSTPKASAAVLELSELHRDLVAGKIELKTVASSTEANQWIATQRESAPDLPDHISGARVQSCCLANVQGELVAVAVLEDGKETVTLVVAQAPNFAFEMGTRVQVDGMNYFGHELNGIRMMMANQDDRWLCVMGDRPYEDLARIAASITF